LLKKLFNINPGEGLPTLILFIYFFAFVAISITGSAARDAYFLNMVNRDYLPLMFLAVAIVLTLVIEIYSRLSKNRDLIQTTTISGLVFAFSLVFIQNQLEGWVIPFLYVWMEVITVITITQFWILAADIFNPRQAKRLFGLLGSGGALAAIIIGSSIKYYVSFFGSGNLLFITIGFLGVVILMANLIRPYRNTNEPKYDSTKKAKKQQSGKLFTPYLKSLAIIIGLAAIVSVIIDYQFKMTAVAAFPIQDDLVNFFGQYYAVTGIATIVIQLFVTSKLLSRFGILVVILILPVFLMLGSFGFFITPILATIYISKFSDQVFKFSLHNAAIQLFWIPVKNTIKIKLKPIIEGSIRTGLQGLSGVLIFIAVTIFNIPIHYLSLSIVLIIIFWIIKSFPLKRLYVDALQSAIEKRQLNFEELTLDIQDQTIVNTIEKALNNADESQQIFALDIIKDIPLTPWKQSLNRLLDKGHVTVKKEILNISSNDDIIDDQRIINLIETDKDLTVDAIEIAGKRKLSNAVPVIIKYLEDPEIEKRIIAAAALNTIDPDSSNVAKQLLIDALQSTDEKLISVAINQLSSDNEILPDDLLIHYLNDSSFVVRNAALLVAETRRAPEFLPEIIYSLADPRSANFARTALTAYNEQDVINILIQYAQDSNAQKSLVIGIIRTLKNYPSKQSISIILSKVDPKTPPIQAEAVDALIHLAREIPLEKEDIIITKDELIKTARYAYEKIITLSQIEDSKDNQLLRHFLQNEIKKLIPVIMKLGILDKPETPIETYIQYVLNNESDKLPYVLEFFENIFSKEEREIVNSLIDTISIDEKCETARNHFDRLTTNLNQFLGYYIGSIQGLKVALTMDYAFRTNNQEILNKVNWESLPENFVIKDIITRHAQKHSDSLKTLPINQYLLDSKQLSMYSTLEKALILNSIDLFESIPSEELIRVAQIAEEEQFETDTPLFEEGDFGDSMYIVANGKVRVHKGKRIIVELEKGACVGEMALLDQEPRSADVTVNAGTTLLKITQDGFYDLMSSNMEIMHGIVKLITTRLRKATN
jgi:AAA family ATP:ADP antiporter